MYMIKISCKTRGNRCRKMLKSLAASGALTFGVIGNALYRKRQFYPAVVYITKSSQSLVLIYVQFLVWAYHLFNLSLWILFGSLSAAENELLSETLSISLSDTLVAFAIFRANSNINHVAFYGVLLASKCYHFLANKRTEEVERSPILPIAFHIRLVCTLIFLEILNYVCLSYAYSVFYSSGISVHYLVGFEYLLMMSYLLVAEVKYAVNVMEKWNLISIESKSTVLLMAEILHRAANTCLLLCLGLSMMYLNFWPLFALRRIVNSVKELKTSVHSAIMWQRAIRILNNSDATEEETRNADLCIICREQMHVGSKRLLCGHIFHCSCLKAWFRRQHCCPTCRYDVLSEADINRQTYNLYELLIWPFSLTQRLYRIILNPPPPVSEASTQYSQSDIDRQIVTSPDDNSRSSLLSSTNEIKTKANNTMKEPATISQDLTNPLNCGLLSGSRGNIINLEGSSSSHSLTSSDERSEYNTPSFDQR